MFPVPDTELVVQKSPRRRIILAGIGLVVLVIILGIVWYLRQPYFIDF